MKELRAGALHDRWMRTDPAYRREYQALEPEFALIEAMIQARGHAHLTQAQLARRMGTTQAVIARLESGRTKPSTRTLERLAKATGMRLRISFEPIGAKLPVPALKELLLDDEARVDIPVPPRGRLRRRTPRALG